MIRRTRLEPLEIQPDDKQMAEQPHASTSPSAALLLMARPGDGGIRTREIAILVADGPEGAFIGKLMTAPVQAGAVPRLVGTRLGTYTAAGGEKLKAESSMENNPWFLFDAPVLPDGLAAVEALAPDGYSMKFAKDQDLHWETILTLGASQALLAEAGIPMSLPDGSDDPTPILADAGNADMAATDFIAAVGMHRRLARDTDPPRV